MRSALTKSLFTLILFLVFGCNQKEVVDKYSSGNIRSKTEVRNGNGSEVKNGFYHEYYENGVLKVDGVYKENRKDSVWREYDESSQEIKREYFTNDTLVDSYDKEGLLFLKNHYMKIESFVFVYLNNFFSPEARNEFNTHSKGIGNLKVYKSIDEGKVKILFDYRDTWPKKSKLIPTFLLFRMFDRHGEFLDYLITKDAYFPNSRFKEMWKHYLNGQLLRVHVDTLLEIGNELTFSVNQNNLQSLEIAEFGILGIQNKTLSPGAPLDTNLHTLVKNSKRFIVNSQKDGFVEGVFNGENGSIDIIRGKEK